MSAITLHLAFPPTELNPNKHLHWSRRDPFRKSYRNECRIDALNVRRALERRGVTFPLPAPVLVLVTFVLPSLNVTRDWDNLIASFKAGQDGALRDSGILRDDSIRVIHRVGYEVEEGKAHAVRVRIVGGGEPLVAD